MICLFAHLQAILEIATSACYVAPRRAEIALERIYLAVSAATWSPVGCVVPSTLILLTIRRRRCRSWSLVALW
ncbi:hypothetical protein C8Q73DRAFT_710467 [Cubamyces lactineus]|nr:hypothetical protein C8Q73DRAFT_710467 [Cubamyces lactineus]